MFSRRISDLLAVTFMTVLIWVYAEGANVQTYSPPDAIPLTIRLTARDLIIAEQNPARVSVSFKGAQAELTRLRQDLRGALVIELDLTEPGGKTLPMAEVLQSAAVLQNANVNLVRVEPQTLELKIEKLETRPIPVEFRPSDVKLVQDKVTIEPATVSVTAPRDLFPANGGSLVLEAVPKQDIKLLAEGVDHRIRATVTPPPSLSQWMEPVEVDLLFSIDRRAEEIKLPSVPVWDLTPPNARNKYDVIVAEDSQVLRDVVVKGPPEDLIRARDGLIRIIGVFQLNSDDLAKAAGKGELTAPVIIHAPPQLIVTAPTAVIRYTVIARPQQ